MKDSVDFKRYSRQDVTVMGGPEMLTVADQQNAPRMPSSLIDGVEMVSLDRDLIVGLTFTNELEDSTEDEVGDDWLKFHFQLRGAAQYSVPGEASLAIEDMTAAMVLHGRGITKSSYISARPTFSVTVMCRPDFLRQRFGIRPADMPRPLERYLESGDSGWFAEVGRMTPAMAMDVRALETMSFDGGMRGGYVEARGISLLCEMWSQVGRRGAASVPAIDDRVMAKAYRTREYIDSHFAQPLAVQQLARNVGTNETKLSQTFRKVFGMTIFEYVRHCRMEEGRRLLRAGHLSVTEIAFDVGYEHSCNFSVAYKRHFGMTPKDERRLAWQ